MTRAPMISIVIATYNAAHMLHYAIRSAIDSELEDWEMIVVGDYCTDETERCVRAFNDSRISYVNLPENCGEQSGPNNRGLALARGKYIAFLNHDDMYFPDHLTSCVSQLESSGADLVWVPCAVAKPITRRQLDAGEWDFQLYGAPGSATYSPYAFYSASSWLFKRELIDTVGPWRSAKSLFVTPSQDWLFRAWRSGAKLKFIPRVSVLLIFSGERKSSYVTASSLEHEVYFRAMRTDPKFREIIMQSAAVNAARTAIHKEFDTPVMAILRGLVYPIYILLIYCGVHPKSLNMLVRFGRKGSFIRHIRRYTGLK